MTGGIGIYVYLSNRDKVTNTRIGKLEDDIDDKFEVYGERIATLETRADGALTHTDISVIHEKINKVSYEVSTLSGQFIGVKNLLDTIHNHLLRKS